LVEPPFKLLSECVPPAAWTVPAKNKSFDPAVAFSNATNESAAGATICSIPVFTKHKSVKAIH
jgi:hypothetical protein